MEFWKTLLDLARRKRVGPPLAGLALLAAVAVFFLVPPRYVSSASMVLTTPPAGGTTDPAKPPGRSNPLLQFSEGLRTTAGILILSMNTEEVAAELGVVKDGPVEVTINDGRTNPNMLGILMNGPFVYVEVESDSAGTSRAVMARTQSRLRAELIRRQEVLGAPTSTFIGFVEVVPPAYPEADRSGTWQAVGGAAFLVVILGLGVAYAVERRRVFRLRSGGGPPGAPVPAPAMTSGATSDGRRAGEGGDDPDDPDHREHRDDPDHRDGADRRDDGGGRTGRGDGRDGGDGAGREDRDGEGGPEPPVTVYPAAAMSPAPEDAALREPS